MKLQHRALGVSLVELLVGISLGLVIVGAMAALYIGTARSYRQLEALAQLQSNARYLFEIMGYDIRMAGNMGCQVPGQASPANFVSDPASHWWSYTDRPLFGQDESENGNAVRDTGFPADYRDKALRGDTLIVVRANPDETAPGVVASYNTAPTNPKASTAPIVMQSGSFNIGSLLLLTDCNTTAAVFQMLGDKDGIQHGMPAGPDQDMAGAKVIQLSANAYYLRNSGRKYASNSFIPSLYRQALTTTGGAPATEGQELVSGVTDMQIRYGVDTGASPAGVIGSYMTASEIDAAGYGWTDPKRVLAVRVTVTLESQDDNVSDVSRSFTLGNGTVITDQRLRRSYTMTFGIRQRLS